GITAARPHQGFPRPRRIGGMEERVEFASDGLRLAGVLHLPAGRPSGARGPAFLVLHGFGSNKAGSGTIAAARLFASLGPSALRGNLSKGSIMEFPFEVVESMYGFTANDVVGRIAPRPLLLLHPAVDSVTPTEQSIDLFLHAGQPTELHLIADVDHFLFSE